MRILIYSYNFLPKNRGGMEKFILSLVQRLKTNHEISLLLPEHHNISIKGIKTYHIKELFPNWNRQNLCRLKAIFMELLKFISFIISSSIVLPRVLKKNKIRNIITFQPSVYSTFINFIGVVCRKRTSISLRGIEGDVNFISQILMDSTFLFSNVIIINSNDLLKRYLLTTYLPKYFYSNKQVFYLPNGINADYWKPDKSDKYKIETDLVFVGNLTDKSQIINKGIKYLYEAVKILRENNNIKLEVLIIGKANMDLLKAMVSPDIDKYFRFQGFTKRYSNIKRQIQRSSIFVITSVSEGMPNSLMEAMALEMPCIASKVGGVPELIKDGVDGLVFEPKNSQNLANLIKKLLEDKNLQKKLGENARKKMINQFNWNTIMKKLEILLKNL